ncbi:MAG: hypothetical protein HOV80_07510 [Polyangiaceae bacterium]|nr:hypothetical protein [Polyangiaceae bacterium]
MDLTPYEKCDAWGMALLAYANAFKQYPTVLEKYFKRLGATFALDPAVLQDTWVPMAEWIKVTHDIVDEVGASTVYAIGKKISETAQVPPDVNSAAAVLMGMDFAFHMNHRKDGVIMFNPQNGQMIDGIGHYVCELQEGGSSATMACSDPYPCDMDRGLLNGFAARFEPAVSVSHQSTTCRKKGDSTCVYLIQW